MVKSLINKIKKGIILATAELFLQGCPSPIPPHPTWEPTAIVSAMPTASPTSVPTSIPDTDYLDVSGKLEYNESHGIGRQGIVRVYDANDPAIETARIDGNFSSITPLGEFSTDSNGYFSATLDKLNSELPNGVVIRAKTGTSSDETSYVRTITLPQGDQSNVLIRAVPYPDFDTNSDSIINETDNQNFKTHVMETNVSYSKWNLDEISKIKIFKHSDKGEYSFDDTAVNNIITKIKDSNNIEKFANGMELDSYVEVIDDSPQTIFEDDCIYVVPNDNISGGVGVAYEHYSSSRIINGARIEMNSCSTGMDNPVTVHEFGHVFIAPDGEARTLPPGDTIMWTTGNTLLQPGVADIKEAKLVNEETFLAGDLHWMRVMNSMLGMSW